MDERQQINLERLLKISQDMYTSASDGAWTEVVNLDEKRQDILEKCFSEEFSEADSAYVSQVIEQVLVINQQLKSLGGHAQLQVAASISEQNKNKSACEAYSNTLSE